MQIVNFNFQTSNVVKYRPENSYVLYLQPPSRLLKNKQIKKNIIFFKTFSHNFNLESHFIKAWRIYSEIDEPVMFAKNPTFKYPMK